MGNIYIFSIIAFSLAFGLGCGDISYSPWDSKVEDTSKELNAQNLARLGGYSSSPFTPFTIALIADPGGTPGDLRHAVKRINEINSSEKKIDFVAILGDITNYGLLHEYEWVAKELKKLDIPFLTVPGNHDGLSYGRRIYSDMFGATDYTLDYKDISFVMFNNNAIDFRVDNWVETYERMILGASRSYIIPMSHIPPSEPDVLNREVRAHWLDVNRSESLRIVESLHGHRGGTSSKYEIAAEVTYSTIPRTKGINFSLLELVDAPFGVSAQLYDCNKHKCYLVRR